MISKSQQGCYYKAKSMVRDYRNISFQVLEQVEHFNNICLPEIILSAFIVSFSW